MKIASHTAATQAPRALGTSLVGEETPRLWRAFLSDPLGFGQILGHCATQCRVVVIADMVALTLRASWVSLSPVTSAGAPTHISSTRAREDGREQTKVKLTSISKGIRKMCSASIAARGRAQARAQDAAHAVEHSREWMPNGADKSTAISSHPTMAALSRLCRCSCGRIWRPLMMRWSAMLNGGVTLA